MPRYWGEAFHSLRAAFDFTVVQRLSSRGFGPPWWYLVSVGQWSTLPLAILAGVGLRHQRSCAIWVVVPLCALSALPHKEARYMIPVVPFVCLLAVEGLRRSIQFNAAARRDWLPAALVCGLSLGLIHDVAHYRLPRSNAEVQLALYAIRERRNARRIGSGAGVADGRPSVSAAGSHCRSGSGDDAKGWISRFQVDDRRMGPRRPWLPFNGAGA